MTSFTVFNRPIEYVSTDDLLEQAEAAYGLACVRAELSVPHQLVGRQHPVVEPYSALRAAETTEARFRGGMRVRTVPATGWACAALAYWTDLATCDVPLQHPRRAVDPPTLFEVETLLRYVGCGLDLRDNQELPNGKRSEFSIDLDADGPLHVECKLVRSLLREPEVDAMEAQLALLHSIEEPLVAAVPTDWAGFVIVRVERGVPSVVELVEAAVEACVSDATAKRTWGRVDADRLHGMFVGGLGGWNGMLAEREIHATDGFVHARYTLDGGPLRNDELLCFPRQVVVAVGTVRLPQMDELLRRQFDKASRKLRGTDSRLIAHLRLHVPEVLCDQLPPWMTLRREGWMATARDRIAGLMANAPPGLVGVEISSLEWTGADETEGACREHVLFLPNPNSDENAAILAKLAEARLPPPAENPERSRAPAG